MNKLLERILDIIANDAFPDGDKPYIIREVVASWNEAKDQVPDTNETWYDEKHVEAEKEKSYKEGYHKGISVAMQKFNEKPASLKMFPTETQVGIIYRNGFEAGFEKGKQSALYLQQRELDERWDAGYSKGFAGAKEEVAGAVVSAINNTKYTTGGIPK